MSNRIQAFIVAVTLVLLAGVAALSASLVSLGRDRDRAARAFERCRGVRVVGTVGGDAARLCVEPEGGR